MMNIQDDQRSGAGAPLDVPASFAGTMVGLAMRLEDWLNRPDTKAAMGRAMIQVGKLVDSANRVSSASVARYADTVAAEKNATLIAIEDMSVGVHKADVPGLVSLGASEALIARAEAGGPARPKVGVYLAPIDRLGVQIGAYRRLMLNAPLAEPSERRRDFELLPHRDRWIHALVVGELKIALDAGLGRAEAREAAYARSAAALRRHASKGMSGLTSTSTRRAYRAAEALAKGDRDGVVLPPLAAEAFNAWMAKGTLPAWLQD